MKRKIAIFQYDLGVGGIQKSLINLLNTIDIDKFIIDLYLFEQSNFYNAKLPNSITIKYIKPFNKLIKFLPFSLSKKFAYNISDEYYDVSIDFNSYQNECAAFALRCNAHKHVIWCHNDVKIKRENERKYKILWSLMKGKFYLFDNIVAVSKGAKQSFVEQTHINADKVCVIPNIINTKEIFSLKNEKTKIEPDLSKYNLITVGRISHQKGIDILIDLMNKVIDKNKKLHLYIVGDGKDKSELINQAKRLGLSNYITFIGYEKNPYAIMNKMDGFILTSRYEGQGMVLLEAKSIGLDIYMPKHLEKYVEDIKGQDDLVEALSHAQKNVIKIVNSLDGYNSEVINKFNELCS